MYPEEQLESVAYQIHQEEWTRAKHAYLAAPEPISDEFQMYPIIGMVEDFIADNFYTEE